MVELTHPPQVVWGNPQDDVFKNSAGFISAELGPTPATFPDQNRYGFTRRVQRDRALLWEIEKADSNREPPEAVRSRLLALGRAQKGFLALLAPHVSCLAEFVEATKDRRFVDYRTVNLVQDLFVIAHTWSKYEKRVTLESMGARGTGAVASAASMGGRTAAAATMSAGADSPRAAASSQARDELVQAALAGLGAASGTPATIEGAGPSTQLGELLRRLSGRLARFSRWSQDVMGVWAGAASTSQQERAASATCEKSHNALSNVAAAFGELSRDERLLSTSGFTPYVTIFVAQILSALDDHGAAVELLVDWLDDLDEIEAATEGAGIRGYERQIAWYRLQSFIEVLILQKLSEHSPGGLPATPAALRATLDVVFPGAVEKLVNLDSLHAWRAGSSECRSVNQSWKQGIVLSYLSWVKEYPRPLATRPRRGCLALEAARHQAVELLADANFNCFEWILVEEKQRRKNPLALASERAASRVEFTTTAAAVRILEYEASRQWGAAADDRNKTLLRSETELRAAISRLNDIEDESAELNPPAQTQKLTRLLFREPRQELLANARAVLNRMEALRKHR
jgi:hypothetical protein